MNNIDETLEKELKNIKETKAEKKKENKKPKYSNFAIKCLYNNIVVIDGKKRTMMGHMMARDEVYLKIIHVLSESDYILNKSYLVKYIAYKTNKSTSTVYSKLNELVELDVVEYVDKSVRLTRLVIRKMLSSEDIKTINYKTDSKTRSKLKINMYERGYRLKKQDRISELLGKDLAKEKVIILNDREILLLHKELDRGIQHLIYEINKEMNFDRFRRQGIDLCTLTEDEKDKLWVEIEKIYVTTKRMEGHEISEMITETEKRKEERKVKTEILKDVIDFEKY